MAAPSSTPPPPAGAGVTGGSAGSWSDRFEQGLHPAIERFNASIGFDLTLLQEDLDGSIAHARMLGRCGVLSEAEADGLIEALEQVRAEAAVGRFQPGLDAEDVHFAVERRLIELVGPLGKKLHTGRSRNDQVGTDLRLWLRRRLDAIEAALERFQKALLEQALRHADCLIPGYTHLQRAQPLCLAHHLLAYIEMVERDRERLSDVRRRVDICPLGAAALAGTPVPIDRRATAAELGFRAIYANS
ncbi:MAG: argininosuccinate lyase, partial [Vulcanococcus sp.]